MALQTAFPKEAEMDEVLTMAANWAEYSAENLVQMRVLA